jgi:WD40 repeat protein
MFDSHQQKMSGYRSLHRQDLFHRIRDDESSESNAIRHKDAVWSVATCAYDPTHDRLPSTTGAALQWRLFTASSDGYIRSFLVQEKSATETSDEDSLDASALRMSCSHIFRGPHQALPFELNDPPRPTTLGMTVVSVDSNKAGDLIIVGLELSGIIRVWTMAAAPTPGKNTKDTPSCWAAIHEFRIPDATGTTLQIVPLRFQHEDNADIMVVVGCLDGTVALVATGLTNRSMLSNPPKNADAKIREPTAPGTILDHRGRQNSHAIPLRLSWNPVQPFELAVGRQDGTVDVVSMMTDVNTKPASQHRLTHLRPAPVRAVCYFADGSLLVAGNDDGIICVWDAMRPAGPVLVHHVVPETSTTGGSRIGAWILDIVPVQDSASSSNSRRFVSTHTDRKIHVWDITNKLYQPVHSFSTDTTVFSLHAFRSESENRNYTLNVNAAIPRNTSRLVAGSDNGWIQVFSLANQ